MGKCLTHSVSKTLSHKPAIRFPGQDRYTIAADFPLPTEWSDRPGALGHLRKPKRCTYAWQQTLEKPPCTEGILAWAFASKRGVWTVHVSCYPNRYYPCERHISGPFTGFGWVHTFSTIGGIMIEPSGSVPFHTPFHPRFPLTASAPPVGIHKPFFLSSMIGRGLLGLCTRSCVIFPGGMFLSVADRTFF